MNSKPLLLALLALGLAGCAGTPDQYYWGEYESILYKIYQQPGSVTEEQQISLLETDIEQAENRGKPVPPGIYLHLGMVYASLGMMSDAMAAFASEQEIYPESRPFIEGMLERAEQNAKEQQ